MDAKPAYFFILSALLCGVSSCSEDVPADVTLGRGAEVAFNVSSVTRATGDDVAFDKFLVYGDMMLNASDPTGPTILFNKTEVVRTGDAWSYEGTQYWIDRHQHSFVAIYPESAVDASNSPLYQNSKLTFTYTIPTADGSRLSSTTDVDDILTATHRRQYSEADPASVTTLNFGHMLSRIHLAPALDDNLMRDDEYIEIRKIEVSGFKTGATFSIMPAALQSNPVTDDRVIEVTGHSGSGIVTIEPARPIRLANGGERVSLLADEAPLIMLPQAFEADSDAKIVISYNLNYNTSQIEHVEFPLDNQVWEWGKSYTYRFTITRRGAVTDGVSIGRWEEAYLGGIIAQ